MLLFSLSFHIALTSEKIPLIHLVCWTPQKGKYFNMLVMLEKVEKGYGGKCQIGILLKIKLYFR